MTQLFDWIPAFAGMTKYLTQHGFPLGGRGLGDFMNAFIDQDLQFLGIPSHVSALFIHDKGWKSKDPVSYLFPESEGGLCINHTDLDAVFV